MKALFIILFTLVVISCTEKNYITYKSSSKPYTSDPLEYDFFAHHEVFRSTFSSLVTNYSTEGIKGVLATSWHNEGLKTWVFKIREDIYYSNGDKITTEDIQKSFKRILFLLWNKGSREGIVKNIIGVDRLKNLSDELVGITSEGQYLTFRLKKPEKDFLEKISFGIYSVSHPKNYDSITGKWLNPFNFISSGAYFLKVFNKDSIELELNKHFCNLGHPKKYKRVVIVWGQNLEFDITVTSSKSLIRKYKNYIYTGGIETGTSFLRCHSWDKPGSICFDKASRVFIRNGLYQFLDKNGVDFSTSFFPRVLKGLKYPPGFNYDLDKKYKPTNLEFKFLNFSNPNTIFLNDINNYFKKFNVNFVNRETITNEKLFNDLSVDVKQYYVDIFAMSTTLLIETPYEDIDFMFNSKAGIVLPDSTGKIKEILKDDIIDVNKINEELWNQGIIWPITHYSKGLYYHPDIDLSMMNILETPIDFTWVGQN